MYACLHHERQQPLGTIFLCLLLPCKVSVVLMSKKHEYREKKKALVERSQNQKRSSRNDQFWIEGSSRKADYRSSRKGRQKRSPILSPINSAKILEEGSREASSQTANTTPIFSVVPSVSTSCSALLHTAAATKCPANFRVLICAWAWVSSHSAFICKRWHMSSPTCCRFPDNVPWESIKAAMQLWDEKEGSYN